MEDLREGPLRGRQAGGVDGGQARLGGTGGREADGSTWVTARNAQAGAGTVSPGALCEWMQVSLP